MSVYLDIEKRLGSFHLQVQMEAQEEVLALLGASGCGKSMTLKCIAGIERPDRGRIVVDGVTVFDSSRHIHLPPQQRRCGLLFQNYALFPHMTVRKNILTGTLRDYSGSVRQKKADEIMERFGIADLADHLPSQLSGGQQQRAALARILVSDPRVLLLDEPFSALDSHLRFRMEEEVRQIIRSFGKSVLLVSHDRDEVFRLSDKIAVMNEGKVEVAGSRDAVFSDPQTRTACILTGCKNISPIRKLDEHRVLALDWGLELKTARAVGDAAYIGIRHHNANTQENENEPEEASNAFTCEVVQVIENPFTCTAMLRLAGRPDLMSFGWETDKKKWQQIAAGMHERKEITIHIPARAVLPLRA